MPRKVGSGGTAQSAAKKTDYATPALEKGLDVLELLARTSAGLTKSQIARELNRSVSEIFRMLICLERRGYIAQTTGEVYTLTLRLFQLVQEHPPTERLIVDAIPVLQQLSHKTMQSCHLGVLEGGRVVILAQSNAPANTGFYVRLGSTVDLMDAASGYVILAHLTSEHRERTLTEWGRVSGRRPPQDLPMHLERIRKAGYEKRASYLVKGVLNISFPVFDSRGEAVAALTVPYIEYLEAGASRVEVVAMMQTAAEEITRAIGGRGRALT